MTRAAAPVISVRFDERPREWRNYVEPRSVDDVVDAIVSPPPARSVRTGGRAGSSRGDGRADAPRLPFDSQGAIEFEPRDALGRDRLRGVVRAHLVGGARPELVRWRALR